MKLGALIAGISILQAVQNDPHREVQQLAIDSRIKGSDMLFAAIEGMQSDGHTYIDQAIDHGAVVILCKKVPQRIQENITYLCVEDTAVSIALIADRFYDSPSRKMKVVGITGTNAKTSIATLLHGVCQNLNLKSGLISTVCVRIGDRSFHTTHTTPGSIEVQRWLHLMLSQGCRYVFMEVSSHALIQYRTLGISFAGAIFSNLSQDHLDYHGTMKAYRDAKKILFDQLDSEAFALTNADDPNGTYLLQNTKARRYDYAIKQSADFHFRIVASTLEGLCLRVMGKEFWVSWIGDFNAFNFAAAFGALRILKVVETTIELCKALSTVSPPKGRMERWERDSDAKKLYVYIDYAHTPDALQKSLTALRKLRTPHQQILTVAGCGGDRDHSKRESMGKVVASLSDKAVFTSDNPRFENPSQIIAQMLQGVPKPFRERVVRQEDRKKAIHCALRLAKPRDIVLVAGKGHEVYQEIDGKKIPFDDREVIDTYFKTDKT